MFSPSIQHLFFQMSTPKIHMVSDIESETMRDETLRTSAWEAKGNLVTQKLPGAELSWLSSPCCPQQG